MSIANRLRSLFRLRRQARQAREGRRAMRLQRRDRNRLSAAYDAISDSKLVSRYWANADNLSPDAATSASVRAEARKRARYECLEANSFAKGIVHTLANDTIGTGPRLQFTTPNRDVNQLVERSFGSWARQAKLPNKLRTMRVAKCVDGEAFAYFTTNARLRHRVQLDLALVEADQISTPFVLQDGNHVDGIVLDDAGNPIEYHLLRAHPGSNVSYGLEYDPLSAEIVIHLFRPDRPGQHRGIPEVITSLPLFALLRDYTLAVLQNARSVAKFTLLMKTNSSAIADDGSNWDPSVEAFDVVDIDYDMITSLPFGWDIHQLKTEQPNTTFQMFRDAILNEIARAMHMPFNIAAGNSAGYNYASGRLDHQMYFKSISVERSLWEQECLDRILEAWLDEAILTGAIPTQLGTYESITDLPHQWFWDGAEHVDPAKEASGQKIRLSSGTTHRAREYASQGLDVDVEDQRAAEAYGVDLSAYRRAIFESHFPSRPSANGSTNPTGGPNGNARQETRTPATSAS